MILLLCCLAFLAPAFVKGLTCDENWIPNPNNGKCYMMINKFEKRMNWTDSMIRCENLNATIASASNKNDDRFVFGLLNATDETDVWLGAIMKDGNSRPFTWQDGSNWNYTNWMEHAPNNGGGIEHCLWTSKKLDGKWNDIRCYLKKPAICQKP